MFRNIVFVIALLGCCQVGFAQKAKVTSSESTFPSIDDMMQSLASGKDTDVSLESSIDSLVESMTQQMATKENTAETVKSAVEGTLVVEEIIPEANRNVVEAVDLKTKRYSPRLKVDFTAFPLRPLSGKIVGAVENSESVDLFDQTNSAITADIARRIQERLKIQNVNFEFKDRTAKLSGTVETPRQRDLAEMMIRMEPGIDEVKNEIVIKNQ